MTLFEKIVAGEIPSHKVAEDDQHFAFLDIFPLKRGHTLVIPKKAVDYIYDLDDEELASLHVFAKRVAKAVEKVIPCQRIGVAVIGLEVPHAHVHLIPINEIGDVSFANAKLQFSEEEFALTAEKIRDSFE